MMKRASQSAAILLIRRGFTTTSRNIGRERRCFSRVPTIDFSSIRGANDAVRLFREIVVMSPQPSDRVYANLLSVVTKMEEYRVALSVFDEMRQLGVGVTDYAMNIAINCCCHLKQVDCAFAIMGSFFKLGYEPNARTFSTLLRGLYSVGRVAEAENLLIYVMNLKLCELDDVMISTVMNGTCKAGQSRSARDLLQVLEQNSYKPNVYSYSVVIDGLCSEGMVDDALHLLSKMVDRGISPNVFTYSSIIEGLCRFHRWNEVKYLLLVEMVRLRIPPNVITFTIMVDAFCKQGMMKEAEDVLELMVRINVHPNIVTFSAMIHGYSLKGQMVKAKEIFDSTVERGLKHDIFNYMSLINGYCKNGNLDEAWRLFNEIQHIGLKHTVVSYSTMIHGLFRVGRYADGWKLFNDMEACHISPDLDAYNIFLDGLCQNQKIVEAFDLLRMMDDRGVKPDIVTYGTLIDGLCKAGRVDVAKHILLDQLPSKGLQPNVKIYTMIIGSLFLEGLYEEGKHLFLEMEKSGCVPDSKTYNVIVWMLLKRNEVYKAIPFLEEMYKRGFSADSANVSLLRDKLQREGRDDGLLEMIMNVVPQLKHVLCFGFLNDIR